MEQKIIKSKLYKINDISRLEYFRNTLFMKLDYNEDSIIVFGKSIKVNEIINLICILINYVIKYNKINFTSQEVLDFANEVSSGNNYGFIFMFLVAENFILEKEE